MAKNKESPTIRVSAFAPFLRKGDKIYVSFYAGGKRHKAVVSLEQARLAVMYALPLVGSIGANIIPLIRIARKSLGG